MKKTILFLLLVLMQHLVVKAQFGPAIYVDTLSSETIKEIVSIDFNLDKKVDLLTAVQHWPKDKIYLYTNIGGNKFSRQTIAELETSKDLESIAAGDINKDGLNDFVMSYDMPGVICWFENTFGHFIRHTVDSNLDMTQKVLLRDFNNDGYNDILSLQHTNIFLYLYDPVSGFGKKQLVHSGTEFYAIDAADYNKDGLPDIAVASFGFEILLNNGTGGFTFLSSAGLRLCFGLNSGDVDNDGDIDIVAYESLTGLLRYDNDGSGNFTAKDTVFYNSDHFRQYVIKDLDLDGDADICNTIPQRNKVTWMKNDATGKFSAPDSIHRQPGQLIAACAVADINGDGKEDVIWGNEDLAVHLNLHSSAAISEIKPEQLIIYPNPASESVHIVNNNNKGVNIAISNITGVSIASFFAGVHEHVVTRLPQPGLYIISIRDEQGLLLFTQKTVRY